MIPNKELSVLANALMNTNEFKTMKNNRKKVQSNPQLFKQAKELERQKQQILNGNMPALQKSKMLQNQVNSNKELFNKPEIKSLLDSTENFQKLFSECISYLNKNIDAQINK